MQSSHGVPGLLEPPTGKGGLLSLCRNQCDHPLSGPQGGGKIRSVGQKLPAARVSPAPCGLSSQPLCVCFLQISFSTSTRRAPRGCPKPPSWCTAGKERAPGGGACWGRGPGAPPPASQVACEAPCPCPPGITAWPPWCTTDSGCGPTTLSTTACPSTTPQVTWGLPSQPPVPWGPRNPTPLGRQYLVGRNT